jgi:hypothetical protein
MESNLRLNETNMWQLWCRRRRRRNVITGRNAPTMSTTACRRRREWNALIWGWPESDFCPEI